MLTIDVISDVICPWCFIGKRRLEKALGGRPATVRWHPFQLNPDMPREGIDRRTYRIRKFGSWERSLELDAQVAAAGRGEGIAFHFDRMARTPNTLDAHRIIWLAGERGVQDAVVRGPVHGVLHRRQGPVRPGHALGHRGRCRSRPGGGGRAPGGRTGLDAVRAGEQEARRLGVSGVPFFVINGKVALSGAQPPELFLQAFEQAGVETDQAEACEIDPATGERVC